MCTRETALGPARSLARTQALPFSLSGPVSLMEALSLLPIAAPAGPPKRVAVTHGVALTDEAAAQLPVPQPQALQGHDDENWPASLAPSGVSTPALEARYKALGKMRPGIRRYNM